MNTAFLFMTFGFVFAITQALTELIMINYIHHIQHGTYHLICSPCSNITNNEIIHISTLDTLIRLLALSFERDNLFE